MFNSFGLKIFYFLKGRGLKNDFSVGGKRASSFANFGCVVDCAVC